MALASPGNPIVHRFTDFGKDRIEVADWTIRVRDAFNLSYVYMMVHDWLVEEGWGPRKDEEFPETYYIQRDNPQIGKEIWIRWRLLNPMGKPGLFSYALDLNWKMIGLKEIEISYKGQKVKADRAEFELVCTAALIVDRTGEWRSWPFSKIKELYTKRTMRNKVLMHRKIIYVTAYRLRDLIMNYLKLETFLPLKEAGEFYLKRTLE